MIGWLPRFGCCQTTICFAWGEADGRIISFDWGRIHLEFSFAWDQQRYLPPTADEAAMAWFQHYYCDDDGDPLIPVVPTHHLIDAYVAGFELGQDEKA